MAATPTRWRGWFTLHRRDAGGRLGPAITESTVFEFTTPTRDRRAAEDELTRRYEEDGRSMTLTEEMLAPDWNHEDPNLETVGNLECLDP